MDPGTVPFWRTFMRHLFFGDLGRTGTSTYTSSIMSAIMIAHPQAAAPHAPLSFQSENLIRNMPKRASETWAQIKLIASGPRSGPPRAAAYSLELAHARVFAVLFLLVLIIITSGVVAVLIVVVLLVLGEDGAARATVGLGLEDGGES